MTDDKPTIERIEDLEQTVSDLCDVVDALRRKTRHLEERLPDEGGGYDAGFDQYDAPVVQRLEVGETYTRDDLITMYQTGRSTVRDEEKIRSRIQGLVKSGVLSSNGAGHFRCNETTDAE